MKVSRAAARVAMEEDETAPDPMRKQLESLHRIRSQRLLQAEADLTRARQRLRDESADYRAARSRLIGLRLIGSLRLGYAEGLLRKKLLPLHELQAWRDWEEGLRQGIAVAGQQKNEAAERWLSARAALDAVSRDHRLAYLGLEKLKLLEQEISRLGQEDA